MDNPGVQQLAEIWYRRVDAKADALAHRKELAAELTHNCEKWAQVLLETFDQAVRRWEVAGREAAEAEIVEQEMDFMKLNYHTLRDDSPILGFLVEDDRFASFAFACERFYRSALNVKRLAYGGIRNSEHEYITLRDVGVHEVVNAWRDEVESALEQVRQQYMTVQIIKRK